MTGKLTQQIQDAAQQISNAAQQVGNGNSENGDSQGGANQGGGGTTSSEGETRTGSGDYSRFAGKAIPKVSPRESLETLPAAEETRINTGLNTLKTNQKEAETKDTKVTVAKAAAPAHQDEPKQREAEAVVDTIGANASNSSNLPNTDDNLSKTNTANYINQNTISGDPDRWSDSTLASVRNNVRDKMKPVDDASVTAESLFDTELPGNAQLPSAGSIPTAIEVAPATEALDLGANPMGDLTAENADFSGITEVLEENLASTGELAGTIESDEMSGYHYLVQDDWAELTGENGPESFTLTRLQEEVAAKEGAIKTAIDTAETTRKQNMDAERTTHLGDARTHQAELKDAHKALWDNLVTGVTADYDTADGIVTRELGDLKARFDGGSSPKGGTYIGLDATIDVAIDAYKALVVKDFLADDLIANGERSARRYKPDFIEDLDKIIEDFNGYIDTAVNACKAAINTARTNINTKVTNFKQQNGSLGQAVQAKIDAIQKDLDDLEAGVDTEAEALREELGLKREETIAEIDEWIESLKVSWMDLVNAILSVFLDVGEAALWSLLKTFGVANPDAIINELKRFASVIGDIMRNPGAFARNLVTTIKEGFTEYFQNFGDNMQEILFTWLLGQPDLRFPSDFSAASWIEFAFQAAFSTGGGGEGGEQEGGGGGLDTSIFINALNSIQLPGGVNIALGDMVNAFIADGLDGLLSNVQTQIDQIIPETESGEGETTEGEGETDFREEVAGLDWKTFIQYADVFLDDNTIAQL